MNTKLYFYLIVFCTLVNFDSQGALEPNPGLSSPPRFNSPVRGPTPGSPFSPEIVWAPDQHAFNAAATFYQRIFKGQFNRTAYAQSLTKSLFPTATDRTRRCILQQMLDTSPPSSEETPSRNPLISSESLGREAAMSPETEPDSLLDQPQKNLKTPYGNPEDDEFTATHPQKLFLSSSPKTRDTAPSPTAVLSPDSPRERLSQKRSFPHDPLPSLKRKGGLFF